MQVTLPVALTLYGQSTNNIWVSSNGVSCNHGTYVEDLADTRDQALGLQSLNYEYANHPLPYFGYDGCASDSGYQDPSGNVESACFMNIGGALPLWDDLYIVSVLLHQSAIYVRQAIPLT